jgi:23S rRNA pseudouridine1911/1915/1917 synthase
MQDGSSKFPKVIFEDNKIVVVVKPVGLLSQSDFTKKPDVLTLMKAYIKEKYNKPGDVYLGLVHRLDKEVGGIMVLARNSKSAKNLSEQIVNHQFNKKYIAMVEAYSLPESGVLEDYLLKNEYKNITEISKEGVEGAKKSILKYKLLKKGEKYSTVEIQLITGRSHQIRAQFGLRGMPLRGDVKYGAKNKEPEGIYLWAYSLSFIDPNNKERVEYKDFPEWYKLVH